MRQRSVALLMVFTVVIVFGAFSACYADEGGSASTLTANETLVWINKKLSEYPKVNSGPTWDEQIHDSTSIQDGKLIIDTFFDTMERLRSRENRRLTHIRHSAYIRDLDVQINNYQGVHLKLICRDLIDCILCQRIKADPQMMCDTSKSYTFSHQTDTDLARRLQKAFIHLFKVAPVVNEKDPF